MRQRISRGAYGRTGEPVARIARVEVGACGWQAGEPFGGTRSGSTSRPPVKLDPMIRVG